MSVWTHVAGVVRIDGFTELNQDEIFGKECKWNDGDEVWREFEEHKERFLPYGSEGTLEKLVWRNPRENEFDAFMVTIFGDLRDHYNPDAIVEWFKSTIEKHNLWVRNAVITVRNELNGTRTFAYDGDD